MAFSWRFFHFTKQVFTVLWGTLWCYFPGVDDVLRTGFPFYYNSNAEPLDFARFFWGISWPKTSKTAVSCADEYSQIAIPAFAGPDPAWLLTMTVTARITLKQTPAIKERLHQKIQPYAALAAW